MMEQKDSSFMVFSVDQGIQCIEVFTQSIVFVSTPKGISLHDLSTSSPLAICQHQTTKSPKPNKQSTKKSNDNNQEDINEQPYTQESKQQLIAIQMHYFPIQKTNIKKQNSSKQSLRLGYLVVHYKMAGIAVYKVDLLTSQGQEHDFSQQDITLENHKMSITWNNFYPVTFACAFLKFAFDNINYQKLNSPKQLKKSIIDKQKISQQSINQLQRRLSLANRLTDYRLLMTQRKQREGFYILTNENEMYELKKITLTNGQLKVTENYQVDQQTPRLNSCTVTQIKVIKFIDKKQPQSAEEPLQNHQIINHIQQRQLLIATEDGCLHSYHLPCLNQSPSFSSTVQHYLQPVKTLNLLQKVTTNQHQKAKHQQPTEFIISQINLIDNLLAVVAVRRQGLWLVDLGRLEVVSKVELLGNGKNTRSKTESVLKNVRILNLLSSTTSPSQSTHDNQTSSTSTYHSKTLSHFILATSHSLYSLSLTLSTTKTLSPTQPFPTKIIKLNCDPIQQLNTQLIDDLIVVTNKHGDLNTKYDTLKNTTPNVDVYGHFKQGKILYFTL